MQAPAVGQARRSSSRSGTLTGVALRCVTRGCGRPAAFNVPTDTGSAACCLPHALAYGPTCRRALKVAAVVGTVLLIINQGDVLLAGRVTALVLAKAGLTYLVPFSVSTYSALAANRL